MKKLIILIVVISLRLSAWSQDLQLHFPIGHNTVDVSYAAFTKNGKYLLTRENTTAILWDAKTFRSIAEYKNVNECSFSPDETLILLVSDGLVRILVAEKQKEIFSIKEQGAFMAFLTSDNHELVLCSNLTTSWPATSNLSCIDLSSAKRIFSREINYSYPQIAWNSKKNLVGIYGYRDSALVVNATTGETIYNLATKKDTITRLAFSNDGINLLALTVREKAIKIYDASSGKLFKEFKAEDQSPADAAFSNDGKNIVAGFTNKKVKIWALSSGRIIKEFEENDAVYKVSFSFHDNFLVMNEGFNNLVLRNIETGKKSNEYFLQFIKYAGAGQINADEKLFYGDAKILRVANGEPVHEFRKYANEIKHYDQSANGRFIATSSDLQNVSIWDSYTAKLVSDFGYPDTAKYYTWAQDFAFSSDNKNLFILWSNGILWKWNCESAVAESMYQCGFTPRKIIRNYKRNKLLLIGDSLMMQYNLATFRTEFSFLPGFQIDDRFVSYSPDESLIMVNSVSGDEASVIDAGSGKIQATFSKPNKYGRTIGIISPGNKKVAFLSFEQSGLVYDLQTGKQELELNNGWNSFNPVSAHFSDNGYLMISGAATNTDNHKIFQIWDITTGKILGEAANIGFNKIEVSPGFTFLQSTDSIQIRKTNPFDSVTTIAGTNFMIDSVNHRLVVSNGYGIDIYSLDFKKIASLVSLGSSSASVYNSLGGIAILPDGYYKADPNTIDKLHFLKDEQVVSLSQLDVTLNRPDKIQTVLHQDSVLVNSYKAAYVKRIKKLGVSESIISNIANIPVAEIKNIEAISPEQTGEKLTLDLHASGEKSYLRDYNIWVNGTPLYGSKGIDLRAGKKKIFDDKVAIKLNRGVNVIEFTVTNESGLESFRQPLRVYQGSKKSADEVGGYTAYDPAKPKDHVYFIGIGIDRFNDNTHNLQWSVKDIRDLALKLKDKHTLDDFSIDTLFNEDVNVGNIIALKKKLLNTTVNDRVIISYSGHGLLSKDFDYYLSTYSVDFNNPEKGGLPYEALESLMDSIPARQKLMLIDACHSGEVDKEEMQHYRTVMNGNSNPGLKGGELENTDTTARLGMKNSFELMQELFVNVGRSTGATIISAAAGTQLAQERGDLKNGVFTYSILEYMEQHDSATVTELKNYVNKRVPELTNGLQVPTTRTETKVVDWKVW